MRIASEVNAGASKVSLSTFSSEDLWMKSGRLENGSSEVCSDCILSEQIHPLSVAFPYSRSTRS